MTALVTALFALAAVLLVLGLVTLVLSPLLAWRAAATASRPKLARRASGPERMRALIDAQRTERARRTSLSLGLVRLGVALAAVAALLLIGGVAAWLGGY
jgi:hypothetical protein